MSIMFRTFISPCSYETHIIHLNFTYGVRPLLLLALGPLPLDDVHQLLAAPHEARGIH